MGCSIGLGLDRGAMRTWAAALLLAAGLTPPAGGEVPSLALRRQGHDWPCFLGEHHDSKSAEVGLQVPWPAEGPKLLWQRRLATGYGMPVIARGRLFLFDRVENEARLQCWQSETAQPLWEFRYPTDYEDQYGYDNGPRCSPVVDDDRVYIFGAEGMLHCLRVVDGTLIWKADTARDFGVVQNFFGVGSTPVVFGELLIAQIGGSPPESRQVAFDRLSGNGSAVVAFEKHTGEVRYQLSDELASYASPVLATIQGRAWCFVWARGGLLGFEPGTGQLDFHFPWRAPLLESVNASNPVVAGNRVLISETYGPGAALLAVRPGGYEVVWSDAAKGRQKSLQTHWNTPVHHEGFVYGSSGRHSNNAELRCIELATGAVRWSQPNLARTSLLYLDGHFICLSEYGELVLLRANPDKFDPVSALVPKLPATEGLDPANLGPRRLLEYPAWAAPIVSRGLLYVRGRDRLACYEVIPEPAASGGP